MRRANTKFVHRIIVLCILALTLGIGVAVVKSNPEVSKLVPDSLLRDSLLLISPLAGLAITGYGLTYRMHSGRSLMTEFLVLGFCYCVFLVAALPYFLLTEVGAGACSLWGYWCDAAEQGPNYLIILPVTTVAFALALSIYWREFRN